MQPIHPNSITARRSGVQYLALLFLASLHSVLTAGRFLVPGDSTATAHLLRAGEVSYRLGILSGLGAVGVFGFLAWSLYRQPRGSERRPNRLVLGLVALSATLQLGMLLAQSAPLLVLSGAGVLLPLTAAQADALSYALLRVSTGILPAAAALWGAWLVPSAILVARALARETKAATLEAHPSFAP